MTTALYGRVSSDRQEQEETILSQLAELRERAQEDSLSDWEEFVDEGYGRDNLVRPGLDRLRDLVAQSEVERLYVQAPDRLASGAKLVLLVEEFRQHRVEVVFLKGSVEDTPEGKLLLHMQGAMAEYERTKIAERTRRGKLYWARQSAMVGGHAPYGYRFVRRTDTQRAHLEISEYAATVVRKMYRLLTEEQYSTRAIARHLTEQGIPTARGAVQWQPMAVDRILRNTVYMGTFYYQRNESVEPSKRLTNDPYRRSRKTGLPSLSQSLYRRAYGTQPRSNCTRTACIPPATTSGTNTCSGALSDALGAVGVTPDMSSTAAGVTGATVSTRLTPQPGSGVCPGLSRLNQLRTLFGRR